MASPFTIIADAWAFYRKQPVLNSVAFWLFFAPSAILDAVGGFMQTVYAQDGVPAGQISPVEIAVSIPVFIVFVYLTLWGQACVLTIGRRMIASPAGRNRTSFAAVREEAKKYIFPLFATEVIRTCMTLLWSILLIVPGIIYSIRTAFFDILIVGEDVPYGREALRASAAMTRERIWEIFWRMLVIGVCTVLPATMLGGITASVPALADERLATLGSVLGDGFTAFGTLFLLLCMIALFAELKEVSFAGKRR